MEHFVDVIGMGPGNKNYLLPAAIQKIKQAHILIGGERNLKIVEDLEKETIILRNNLSYILRYIMENYKNQKIAVLVSGDPGFHSMLNYLKTNLKDVTIRVTPGISSITYLFSKLAMPWQNAVLGSVHGEEIDYTSLCINNPTVVLLTDDKTRPDIIAKQLLLKGISNKIMIIGEELSYPQEKIIHCTLEEACEYKADKLCIVVITDEK